MAFVQLEYLGTIQSTGTSVNSSTVTALGSTGFAPETPLLIQPDAAGSYAWVSASNGTVTAANGVLLAAGALHECAPGERLKFLAWISGSGTTNLKVFRALTRKE